MYRPLEKLLKSKCALSFCSYSFRNIILPKISVIFTVKLPLYSLFTISKYPFVGFGLILKLAKEKSLTLSPFEMTFASGGIAAIYTKVNYCFVVSTNRRNKD